MKTNIHIEIIEARRGEREKHPLQTTRGTLLNSTCEKLLNEQAVSTILAIARAEVERLEGEKIPEEFASPNDDAVGSEQRAFGRNSSLQSSIDHWREVIKEYE